MIMMKEVDYFLDRISIHAFAASSWESHSDNPFRNVTKVKIESILHESLLLLAHEMPKFVGEVPYGA